MVFHTRTGALVTLSNNNRTAQRNHPAQEFNNGVVLSAESLRDNQLFEVRIDKKVGKPSPLLVAQPWLHIFGHGREVSRRLPPFWGFPVRLSPFFIP